MIFGYALEFMLAQGWMTGYDYIHSTFGMYNHYKRSPFLPELNNEVEHPDSADFYRRFSGIKHLVLWQWEEDQFIYPNSRALFGDSDEDKNEIDMRDTALYKEDKFGLKKLDEEGRIHCYRGPGKHMKLEPWMTNDYLGPILLNKEPQPSVC